MSNTPTYDKAKALMAEVSEWSAQGFPGATLEDLAKMTSDQPERDAAKAQRRAEVNCQLLLDGAWDIRDELDAAELASEYRMAVYKERLGVRRGKQAFLLMESA